MQSGTTRSVLAVAADESDAAELSSVLAGESTTVVSTALPDLFDELVYSTYHCLVLPDSVEGQRATDIAVGVEALFPDLPVIVVGDVPSALPSDIEISTVDADQLVTPAVVAAIEDAIDGAPPRVAGRDPSPMETVLLSLFEELPHHLYVKDDRARHVMLGRGPSRPTDRIGLTDREVPELKDEHSEAAYRDEMDLIEGEIPRVEVEEFVETFTEHVHTCKMPWDDGDGERQGLVGLTRDITPQKNQERELRRQHERMVKVALITSHEFRNELQIAHGRLELLDADSHHVERIEAALARIASIVDTVVELSSREYDQQGRKPVWLSRLSREVWDTLESAQATLEIEDDARFLTDEKSAGLILQFLFQNALEHGGPAVTVTVGSTPTGFFVANDGREITVDPPESVFDAGFTTVDGNTGFGLYIAEMVADDQEWSLTLTEAAEGSVRFDVDNVNLHE